MDFLSHVGCFMTVFLMLSKIVVLRNEDDLLELNFLPLTSSVALVRFSILYCISVFLL